MYRPRAVKALVAGIIIVLSARVQCALTTTPLYKRCRSAALETQAQPQPLQDWFLNSTCQVCDDRLIANVTKAVERVNITAKQIQDRFHVLIQITTPKLEPELLSITAALLNEDTYVTLFLMDFDRATDKNYVHVLSQEIFSAVPCENYAVIRSRLAIRSVPLVPSVREFCSETVNATSSSVDPLQSCVVLMATSQYRTYSQLWIDGTNKRLVYPVSVVVTDLWGLGAIFLAEEWGIPSIMLTDETSFQKAIGPSKQSLIQSLATIPSEIWRSFSGIVSYAGLNQLRRALELKRRRHRNEFWDAVTAVMVLANRHGRALAAQPRTPNQPLLHLQSPIFPPCLSCDPQATPNEAENNRVVTVIVHIPNDLSASEARRVLRGLAMARKSLLVDNSTCTSNCWHDRMDLRVNWLVNEHALHRRYLSPDPLPEFVKIQHASLFFDLVLQAQNYTKTNPTIVLARCGHDARPAILLGVPTLCYPFSTIDRDSNIANLHFLKEWNDQEIAQQLLRLLWMLQKTTPPKALTTTHTDSLHRVVAAIRTAGSVRPVGAVQKSDSRLATGLQHVYGKVLTNQGEVLIEHQLKEIPFLYDMMGLVSQAMIVIGLLFLAIRRCFPRFIKLPRNARRHLENNLVWEALAARLPEVDTALDGLARHWNVSRRERRGGLTKNGNDSSNGRHTRLPSENGRAKNKKRIGKHR